MQRHPSNPVLKPGDVPYTATTVFNAGVTKHEGRYVMVFRNDYSASGDFPFDGCNLGLATSRDGIEWEVRPDPVFTLEDARRACRDAYDSRFGMEVVTRAYDPRISVIEGQPYLCMAIDTAHGIRGGIFKTDDFQRFDLVSLTLPDNRNMVLFPERVGGRFMRMERPFPMYMREADESFDLWISGSPDLRYWGDTKLLLAAEEVPFANSKIGPGAPPVKTPQGWLTTFHAVEKHPERSNRGWERDGWYKTYYGGVMLLDLEDPCRLLGFARVPLLRPEAEYDLVGFRGGVIFPTGMILEESGEVKVYYGAADTVMALATAPVDDLVRACLDERT